MPLEMLAHYEHIASQPLVLIRFDHALEDFLQQWNITSGNNNREATPIQYVGEWKIIVVGDYDRNTTIVHGVPNASCVHSIAPNMETKLALQHLITVRCFETAIVGQDLCVVFPYFDKLFTCCTIYGSSEECKSCSAILFLLLQEKFHSCIPS